MHVSTLGTAFGSKHVEVYDLLSVSLENAVMLYVTSLRGNVCVWTYTSVFMISLREIDSLLVPLVCNPK